MAPKRPGMWDKFTDSFGLGSRWEKEYEHVVSLPEEQIRKEADEERAKVGIMPEEQTPESQKVSEEKSKFPIEPKETSTEDRHNELLSKQNWLESVSSFTTEKGSVYTVLPDGTVQRMKKAVNIHDQQAVKKPQDLVVFMPDWTFIDKNAPPSTKKLLGDTEDTFRSTFASYFRGAIKGYKGYIVTSEGKKIQTTQEAIDHKGPLFAVVVDKKNTQKCMVPVSDTPGIGKTPVEMKRTPFPADPGAHETSRHVGHQIVTIDYKDN